VFASHFWTYITLALVCFVTEELAPIGGGIAVHRGDLDLVNVAMSVFVGSWLAGLLLYFIGRWRGVWLRRRYPRFGRAFTRALLVVRRRPWRASLAVRYAYGLRVTLPLACGAAHVPVWEYLVGSGISSLTWASLFTVVGWAFGQSADRIMRHVGRYESVLALAFTGAMGAVLFLYLRRSAVNDDPIDRERVESFEKQLDALTGEFPTLPDDEQERRKSG
jgi:membrane protein DedA with SNARE-associated domain